MDHCFCEWLRCFGPLLPLSGHTRTLHFGLSRFPAAPDKRLLLLVIRILILCISFSS